MATEVHKWRFLTPKDLADILRVDESFVEELIRDGEVEALPIGTSWRILGESVDAYIKRGLGRGTRGRLTASGNVANVPFRAAESANATGGGGRKTQEVEFVFLGTRHTAPNSITVLTMVLAELTERHSGFLERFSQEGGRIRRYVSRDRQSLYPGRPDLAEEFAKPLSEGWWVGTNYSRHEIDRIIRRACRVAGIRFGIDFLYVRPRRAVDRAKAMRFVGMGRDPDTGASTRHDELFVQSILNER